MISAKIIADSIGPNDIRLTSFVLTYPRFVHSEFMSHRAISKNAASSRAIPVRRLIDMVKLDPAMPISFNRNQKGMQAGGPIANQDTARSYWLAARDAAVIQAQRLSLMDVHKEYVNRLLEPFMHMTVICTATDWNNFFSLRCHPDAQPEINRLATLMKEEMEKSTPRPLLPGEWHLPFIDTLNPTENDLKRSVAKCARVSYLNHDGTETTLEADLALYDRLVGSIPAHSSPAEHQAQCLEANDTTRHGNFKGWLQYRQTIPNNVIP